MTPPGDVIGPKAAAEKQAWRGSRPDRRCERALRGVEPDRPDGGKVGVGVADVGGRVAEFDARIGLGGELEYLPGAALSGGRCERAGGCGAAPAHEAPDRGGV